MNQLVPQPPEHAGDWRSCPCHVCASRRKCNGHLTVIAYPPGERAGNDHAYELTCETCGYVGCADTLEQAQTIPRMHEELEAVLVDSWTVPEDCVDDYCVDEPFEYMAPQSHPRAWLRDESCCGKAAPSSEDLDQ